MLRILLLEDSLLDTELIQAHLSGGGIDGSIVRVETSTDFRSALQTDSFDLILSDYSLPAFDGIAALEMAQTICPDVPFIFVSATLGEELAIATLKSGATDYVLKHRLERLVPAVQRALREAKERVERQQAQAALHQLTAELERRVEERTAQLAKVNESLRAEIAERKRVEDSLRRSESTLRSYFELPLIGIAISSPDKNWLDVNDKLCDILGYEQHELRQLTWADLTHPDDLAADLEQFNKLLAGTSDGYLLDKRFIRKDGQVIYANISVRCVRRADESIDYFVAVVQDITERKTIEERLRFLESVAVTANDAIVITEAEPIDEPGPRIIYVNEAFTRMTGYSPEEVLGKTPRILQGQNSDRTQLDKLRAALKQWQPSVVELNNYRKDGSEFWVEISIVPVANAEGWYTHWIAVERDITDRKLAEDALRLSDEILSQMPDAVFLTDLELNIQKWTGKAEEMFGYTAPEVMGRKVIFLIRPDMIATITQKVLQTIQETGTFSGEMICCKKDGSEIPIEATAKTLYDRSGNPVGFVSINRDITERLRAEQQREQLIREQAARREAETQGLKSAFLAEASTVLASSLDYETTLASVARLAVPFLADWCAVDILEENQSIRRVAIAHGNPLKEELAWELNRRYPENFNAAAGLLPKVLRTGQSLLSDEISDADLVAVAQDAQHLQILRELNLKSMIVVPLLARGRTLGAITLATVESARRNSAKQLPLVEDLARRAAIAVDNARLYRASEAARKATQEARQIAEETAERNASLQSLTASLSEALSLSQVGEVVVNQALAALKASAGLIALLVNGDRTLEVISACGYPQEMLDTWSRFPMTAEIPIADAIKMQQPIFLPSREAWAQRYPHIATQYADIEHHAWAALPLIVDGSTVGGMSFSFPTLQQFSPEDCSFIQALAQQCAQAIQRARAYAAERQARAEAEAANRMKDEFLATLSHELRTPLNAMLGWTQLLRTRTFEQSKVERALETIDRNTKSLAALIEDILDVSRIMMGKLHLSVTSCELVPIIEAAIETIRPAAEAKLIQIECFFDASAGPVWGDANRLQQVVWNLLSNAIKFTSPGGRVEVRLDRVERLDSVQEGLKVGELKVGELEELKVEGSEPSAKKQPATCQPTNFYAQIQVRDTGKGISPNFLPYVFERFRQENSSSTRSYGGLGLGLAIVRYLVEQHGGTVQAFSQGEGMGATFTVQLPLWCVCSQSSPSASVQSAIATVANSNEVLPTTSSLKTVSPSTAQGIAAPIDNPPVLYGLTVLIVDDEADARDLLVTILEQSGARVIAAASADEVLYLLSQSKADVLVSDIGMPNVDGYALMRHIRQLEAIKGGDIPAVALTAYARESDRMAALEAGFHVHLAKPFDPDQLVNVVAELAGCRRTTEVPPPGRTSD